MSTPIVPTAERPGTLRATAFPPGPGPYVRWELMVEETGEILASGTEFPCNDALAAAASLYRKRFES